MSTSRSIDDWYVAFERCDDPTETTSVSNAMEENILKTPGFEVGGPRKFLECSVVAEISARQTSMIRRGVKFFELQNNSQKHREWPKEICEMAREKIVAVGASTIGA